MTILRKPKNNLRNENVYRKVNDKEKLLSQLVDKSNSFLKNLKERDVFPRRL